jgi:hypothetical protein
MFFQKIERLVLVGFISSICVGLAWLEADEWIVNLTTDGTHSLAFLPLSPTTSNNIRKLNRLTHSIQSLPFTYVPHLF